MGVCNGNDTNNVSSFNSNWVSNILGGCIDWLNVVRQRLFRRSGANKKSELTGSLFFGTVWFILEG